MKITYFIVKAIGLGRAYFCSYRNCISCFFKTFSFYAIRVRFTIFYSAANKEITFRSMYHTDLSIVDRDKVCTLSVAVLNVFF